MRYHFNVDNGTADPDDDGTELASLAAAKCEAVKMAGRMICEAAGEFWDSAEWTMTVADTQGMTLFTLQIVGTEAPVTASMASPRAAPA